MPNGYTPLPLGGEDYFAKYAEIINEEIERAVRKSAKQVAQQAVTGWGQAPYGGTAVQSIIGDIYGGGERARGRAYTEMGLGAALPQFQASEAMKRLTTQQEFVAGESELDRALRRELAQLRYEWELATTEAGRIPWWQSMLQAGAYALPYAF